MKQYFNIYNLIDRENHTRMFLKNVGEVEVDEPLYYYLKFNQAIRELMEYREQHKKEDKENIVLLIENEIPKMGTIYNFIPNRNYKEED